MAPTEPIYLATAILKYSNTAEAQENDLKINQLYEDDRCGSSEIEHNIT